MAERNVSEWDSDALEYQATLQQTLDSLEKHYAAISSRLENFDGFAEADQASVKFLEHDRSETQPSYSVEPKAVEEAWCDSFRAYEYVPDPSSSIAANAARIPPSVLNQQSTLPLNWVMQVTSDGTPLYCHTLTGQCSTVAPHPGSGPSEGPTTVRDKVVNGLLAAQSDDAHFELTLGRTRVYRRVQNNATDMSFTSSVLRPQAWEALSHRSLRDVSSIVSVIALPISVEDIDRIGPDLTFAKMLSKSQASPRADLSPKDDPASTKPLAGTGSQLPQDKPFLPELDFRNGGMIPPAGEWPRTQISQVRRFPREEKPPAYKVAVVGPHHCGKTAIISRVGSV